MGCASSKIDDLPAVALCRERLGYLDLALHQRYVFAETHLAYVHSLRSVGVSLDLFFDSAGAGGGGGLPQPSPVLNLPPQRKGEDAPASAAAVEGTGPASGSGSGHLSHSNSGSHLHFNSDSDDDHHHHHDEGDSGSDGSLHHDSHPSSPPQQTRVMMYGLPDGFNPYPVDGGGGYTQMNYMRRQVTPSVSYQQKPMSIETIQIGGPSSSSYNYPAQPFYQANQMPSSYNSASYYDYRGNYGNSYGYMNYGGGFMGGPAGPVQGQASMGVVEGGWSAMASSSSSKPTLRPPPPPTAPATSTWDFLNLFESNYPPYTASLDSREVREREGIPDLEDEDYEHEVVKQVHGNQKLVEESGVSDSKNDSKRVEDEGVGPSENEAALNRGKPSVSLENNPVEYEVHMVDKKVVGEEGKSEQQGKGGGKAGFRNVFEVVKEIQVQFEGASASGSELDKVLEVGKLRYQRKNAAYQVSSKMLNVITPSLPSSSKSCDASLEPDEDVRLNLAASLQKLHLWEKKLLEEVKAEEKMRVLHDRKIQKVKRMNERGAEAIKIESTRSAIRNLSTKIRIAIQMVDKISVNINKVRDEELWPQLKELMHGLSRMWTGMHECHHNQCQAIDGARLLDALAFPKNPSDKQLEATLQLEHDLINWTCRFSEWVGAQKGFVRALNSWLLKCLLQEPEETADGVAPFSPGRAGAPPVFVICNLWNQSLERISESSEKEVIDSMQVFAMTVWHFRERDKGEMRQRMTANRDIERKVKNLEREDSRMQKEIQALDKKMLHSSGGSDGLSLSGHVVYQSDTSTKASLHSGLARVFEAMDKFTADSVKVYEELLQRSEEVVRDHGKVS